MATKKSNGNNKSTSKKIDPVTVGIAGTAAVAAGVAAIALSKKGNRKKAGKILKDITTKGESLKARAGKGLDKMLKDQQKVVEKAQTLTKSKNGVAPKSGSKKSASSKPSTAGKSRTSSKKTSNSTQKRAASKAAAK